MNQKLINLCTTNPEEPEEFVDKIMKLLDGDQNNRQRADTEMYDQIMSQGIMNCSELK